MKATLAILYCLSLCGAVTASTKPKGLKDVVHLPEFDVESVLRGNPIHAPDEEPDFEGSDLAARACTTCFPYSCHGRCCRYNKCCKKECCLPIADSCGKNGKCYISSC